MWGSKYRISKQRTFHLLQSRSGVLILCSRLYRRSVGHRSQEIYPAVVCLLFQTHLGKNNIEKCLWRCCSCHLEEWQYSVHLITWVSVSSFNCSCCCLGGGGQMLFSLFIPNLWNRLLTPTLRWKTVIIMPRAVWMDSKWMSCLYVPAYQALCLCLWVRFSVII